MAGDGGDRLLQSLFCWKTFYANPSHEQFPAVLCFPGFFAHCIMVVSSHMKNHPELLRDKLLQQEFLFKIHRFFDSLQLLINLIFQTDHIQLKPGDVTFSDLQKENLRHDVLGGERFMLEYYMTSDESKQLYRNALLRESFNFFSVANMYELLDILKERGSIENTAGEIPSHPPNSLHYIGQCKLSNGTKLPTEMSGPAWWGPLYWNIFHSLPHKAKLYNGETSERKVREILYTFIHILPVLIPCPMCTRHYYNYVEPQSIEPRGNIEGYETLYIDIHTTVNKNR